MTDQAGTTRRGAIAVLAASPVAVMAQESGRDGNGQAGGAAAVGYRAPGGGAMRTVGDKLAEMGPYLADYRQASDGADWTDAIGRAFDQLSSTRTAHPAYPNWGVGTLQVGRGVHPIARPLVFSASQVGFGIRGAGRFASVFTKDIVAGQAFLLNPSGYSHFADFTVVNEARGRGGGAAFTILGTNGAHMTAFDRLVLTNFTSGVSIAGVTNGDFTQIRDCEFATDYAYTNNANKNAVSAMIDGCSFGCRGSVLRLGGSGEVSMRGGGANVHQSLVEYREGAGVNGVYPQSVAIDHMKLEYSGRAAGEDARLLIDGRDCKVSPDAGGADTVTVLRDTTYVMGDHPPGDPGDASYDDHAIIDLSGGRHRVHAWGGYLRGTVRYLSDYLENRARWLFGRMRAAPSPARVRLEGSGTHPLIEWWGNEGVADQYRGGQSGLRCIRTGTALLWRHVGPNLINTGVDRDEFRVGATTRYGKDFTIDLTQAELPPVVTIEGLAVFIKSNATATDTRIEWFADAGFASPIASATIPGDARGKVMVSGRNLTVTDGRLLVRITKPGRGDNGTIGALVIHYFPYVD